jgi:type IV pilus assembly protein PilC
MKFSYIAKTKTGETVNGSDEAADKFELARRLRGTGLTIVSLKETAAGASTHGSARGDLWYRFSHMFDRVKLEEKIFFANNLSAMLSAGLSLSRALVVLGKQTKNEYFLSVLHAVAAEIDKGENLSAALGHYPKIFDSVFVSMVEAGEGSGKLGDALKLVGEQMAKTYNLRRKVKGAMIYPGIIFLAMILIGTAMLIFVVPTLAATFASVKVELPLSTRIIIGVSTLMGQYGFFVLLGVVAIAYLLLRFKKTPRGKRLTDTALVHLPLVAPIVRNMNAAVTARTLSSLVSSGVDILDALSITIRVVQNSLYKEVLEKAKGVIQKGGTLASVFEQSSGLYPALLGEMVEVGEETGKLSDMLLRVAIFYEEEVDNVTKDLSTVIEPFLMIVIGAAVLFFAISMIQPIYNIGNAI